MFGGKKKEARQRPARQPGRERANLASLGLMDVPSMDDLENDASGGAGGEDDAALEAELAMLMGGGGGARPKQRAPKKPDVDLDAMVANCSSDEIDAIFGGLGELGRKDLQCALDTAAAHQVVLPTASYIRDRIKDVFLARDESRPPGNVRGDLLNET